MKRRTIYFLQIAFMSFLVPMQLFSQSKPEMCQCLEDEIVRQLIRAQIERELEEPHHVVEIKELELTVVFPKCGPVSKIASSQGDSMKVCSSGFCMFMFNAHVVVEDTVQGYIDTYFMKNRKKRADCVPKGDGESTLFKRNKENFENISILPLYPNPINQGAMLKIELTSDLPGDIEIKVINLEGKVLVKKTYISDDEGRIHLPTHQLTPGSYILQFSSFDDEYVMNRQLFLVK